jgi:hypothetical protein
MPAAADSIVKTQDEIAPLSAPFWVPAVAPAPVLVGVVPAPVPVGLVPVPTTTCTGRYVYGSVAGLGATDIVVISPAAAVATSASEHTPPVAPAAPSWQNSWTPAVAVAGMSCSMKSLGPTA